MAVFVKVGTIVAALVLAFSLSFLGIPPAAARANDEVPCIGEYHHLVVGKMEITTKQAEGVRDISEKFVSKQFEKIYGLTDTIYMNYTLPASDDSESETTVVTNGFKMCLIKEDDAPLEWSHGFAWQQWAYLPYCFFIWCWYLPEDPINVGLGWTSFPRTGLLYGLRDYLVSQGYTDTSGCALTEYVWDEGIQQWKPQDVTLQKDGSCLSNFRYHNRMWAMSNGYDAVSEHYEHLHLRHSVHSFEEGEDHLASHAAGSCYLITQDNYWLDNYVSEPAPHTRFNDGYATTIYFPSSCY